MSAAQRTKIGSSFSIGLTGLQAHLLTMQTSIHAGLPQFSIIGLPDTALQEARERVRSAMVATGIPWPSTRVTVNLSPASVPKTGSGHDLAIAISIVAALGLVPSSALQHVVALGELNLDGRVLPINGILPMLLYAQTQHITHAVVPLENLAEAQLVPQIRTLGISHLQDLAELLQLGRPAEGREVTIDALFDYYQQSAAHQSSQLQTLDPQHVSDQQYRANYRLTGNEIFPHVDMNEVIGQQHAKQALVVAAAGGHHIMMIGPPGTGKSMLASRFATILPPLNQQQQLEVASIRSLAGTLQHYGISDIPPFEAPHHTASAAALVGGGAGIASPGAVTRAHHGVLFLDEAPEFQPRVLQTIREPLETGQITVARARMSTTFPARIQLILAANPCPCGYGWAAGRRCSCSPREKIRYFHRLSGPILDRIDIQIEVPQESLYAARNSDEQESSSLLRDQVCEARERAQYRFREYGWTCNAQASGQWLREHTSHQALAPLIEALESERLSLRGADRALRLAWTLADIRQITTPTIEEVSTGLALRTHLYA